jgi:lambda family phage portal protein
MSVSRILDKDGQPITATALHKAKGARSRQTMGGFRGASYNDPDLAAWTPPQYSAYSAYSSDRVPLGARIHDLARNDGWIASGLTKKVDAIIGSQWRLNARPNWKALGITRDQAELLADQIEAEWRAFAEDHEFYIDASRKMNFSGLLALAYRHRMLDGEALAIMDWRPEIGCPYATCVQVIDPDRLSNAYLSQDTNEVRDGVKVGQRGEPLGYFIRDVHPGDFYVGNTIDNARWTFYPRSLGHGRRVVIHAFVAERAGQVRGTSMMASLIKKIKNLSRYDEAELQAALINAVMAAIIESPFDHEQLKEALDGGEIEEMSKYQEARLNFYEDTPIQLGGAKTIFTYPGEKVQFTKPEHPNAVFENYIRSGLRNVASVLGLTYEQLSGDWSQSNYSSARGALIEAWRGFYAERDAFALQAAQPIYTCWLEEAIDKGRIKLPQGAPDFYAGRAAWCQASWTGPGRGWVDPFKEAQASGLRLALGLSTYEKECAEQGEDYRENIAQIARENQQMEALGLDPTEFRRAGLRNSGTVPAPEDPKTVGEPQAAPAKGGGGP